MLTCAKRIYLTNNNARKERQVKQSNHSGREYSDFLFLFFFLVGRLDKKILGVTYIIYFKDMGAMEMHMLL